MSFRFLLNRTCLAPISVRHHDKPTAPPGIFCNDLFADAIARQGDIAGLGTDLRPGATEVSAEPRAMALRTDVAPGDDQKAACRARFAQVASPA